MKVLMVDDEELTREGLRMSIPWESLGISQIFMAEDGEEGLRMALELKPDIILADVRMPRMDGITMAFEIRKTLRQCRFIFISGYCDKEYLKSAIQLSAVNYIEKPIEPSEVVDALKKSILQLEEEKRRQAMEEEYRAHFSGVLEEIPEEDLVPVSWQSSMHMADKIEHYKKEKKMLRNTPASYKKEYPWLKEVDSLALANVQLHLESAFHKFFREPSAGFPRFKSKKSSRKSYTTNVVNGNIFLEGKYLKLPKMTAVRMKLHRPISEKWKLKSVTVSREPSGKYFASLLFCCENQTAEKRPAEKFIGIDFAMQGMCVFSTGKRAEYPMFYRNTEKKLAREQRKLSRCQKGSQNYKKQKKRVALCHEKIRNQRKDFQHKLSASLAESFDAVCVEDLNLKGMAGGLHLGKGVHDNGYGLFLSMLEYKLEERGKYLIKVDRYFASSKICSVCGKKKEELSLSDRIYYCECGNRMDRDVNAAVNIMNEGKRIFAECA